MNAAQQSSNFLVVALATVVVSSCKIQEISSRSNQNTLLKSTALVTYRPYRLLLNQLATADARDRQTLFEVFRLHGFKSPAADSANRWLMRQDSSRLHTFQVAEQQYGWPRASQVGKAAVQQAYLLVQHAPAAVHAAYQDKLATAHAHGELSDFNYATYQDRVLLYQERPQRYGTQQGRRVLANGQEEDYLFPVEDLPELDRRRATMQLEPILPSLQPGTLTLKPTKE